MLGNIGHKLFSHFVLRNLICAEELFLKI